MDNIKNKLIKAEQVEEIVNKYVKIYEINKTCEPELATVKVNDIMNFQNAFIHKDFSRMDNFNYDEENCCNIKWNLQQFSNYEVLEFTGDRVIELIVSKHLKKIYPDMDQGELTVLKNKLVEKPMLAYLSENIGFKKFLMISSHGERIGNRETVRFLEDVMEAFMESLFEDSGENYKLCKKFILGMFIELVDINKVRYTVKDHKSALLKLFHANKYDSPKYDCLYSVENVTHGKEFVVIVCIPKHLYIGILPSKFLDVKQKIINTITKDLQTSKISNQNALEDFHKLNLTGIPIGISRGTTKKVAENECSLECINILK